MRYAILLLCTLLAVTACDDDDPRPSSQNADVDNTVDGDTGTDDMSGGSDDAGDMTTTPDATSDASADSGGDDTGADMATEDMGAGSPCADGATEYPGANADIAGCVDQSTSRTQCQAEALCGTGWHMCTASEYQAVYATEFHPQAENQTFWIAGCVRDGAGPIAPVDGVCSSCDESQGGMLERVAWSCVNSVSIETEQLRVGIRSASACASVGVQDAANEGMWSGHPAYFVETGAFCCRD